MSDSTQRAPVSYGVRAARSSASARASKQVPCLVLWNPRLEAVDADPVAERAARHAQAAGGARQVVVGREQLGLEKRAFVFRGALSAPA